MSDDSKTPAKTRRPRKRPTQKPMVKEKTPPPEKPQAEEHYTIGQWHEMPNYSCKHCPWSTLNEDEMVKHIADHLKTPSVLRTDTGFVTPTGARIIREEIAEE